MTTLHTFGCSITQGFALPDVVKPITDDHGVPLDDQQLRKMNDKINYEDIHILAPSQYAWPKVLGDRLGMSVVNHARRGACFQQIARQCAVAAADIHSDDVVIIMWTYLSRLSMQWPARTTVPLCNIVDPKMDWNTVFSGFNKFFGLSQTTASASSEEREIQEYIYNYTKNTYLDPKGIYNHCYNNLVLLEMTHGFLANTGARVIHLSVESDSHTLQLELARQALVDSLREPYVIPNPDQWYTVPVDHASCRVIHDPSIPPAENDQHPSVQHHLNFALHLEDLYFRG
jgi:hypothetical protein